MPTFNGKKEKTPPKEGHTFTTKPSNSRHIIIMEMERSLSEIGDSREEGYQRSLDSEIGDSREEGYQERRHSGQHRRSMSDPQEIRRARNVIIEVPRYTKKDKTGTLWRKTAVINEDYLPDDPIWCDYAAKRLMAIGYGDLEIYTNIQAFVISLPRLARAADLDFIMDSKVWNFIMASWVIEPNHTGGKFDFNISMDVRNKVIKRRATLLRDNIQTTNIDEYGREYVPHEQYGYY